MKKIALVTGVSSGIGRATALALKSEGFEVFGTSRKAGAKLDGVTMLEMDVTDDASVAAGVTRILSKYGRIDLLINNAGFGVMGAAEESSIEQAKALFDTNFFGIIRTSRAVLPSMRQRKSGRIINISSVLGFLPSPFMALYAASKHAVEGYSESLDHEVRTDGIRVSLIQPAYTRTSFDQNVVMSDEQSPHYNEARENVAKLAADVMLTGDNPEVVAAAVLMAVAAAKPKLRYPAGSLAKRLTLLRRFVPAGAFDKTFRKQMRLDSK